MNTDNKFTPGEWIAEKRLSSYWILGQNKERICSLYNDGDKTAANALLIAAAPNLLNALESIITNLRVNIKYEQYPTLQELESGINLIQKAIDKATKQQ